jgi:DNA-damage-inducible protein J
MNTQCTPIGLQIVIREKDAIMAEARLSVRVDTPTKQQAERVLDKLGMSMTTAINVFLKKITAVQGIPFSLTLERDAQLSKSAQALQQAAQSSVSRAIENQQANGHPSAYYDEEKHRPYLLKADGTRDYGIS